jgi:hypothetical protein
MQLIYDKSKFKNNFFCVGMSSNVSSVLKRTADTCESKELTDKQPLFLKAVVDIAKTTPVSEGAVMGKNR